MEASDFPHWKTLKKLPKADRRFVIMQTIKDRKRCTFFAIFAIMCMLSPLIIFGVFHMAIYGYCEYSLLKRLVENLNKYYPGVIDQKDFDAWDDYWEKQGKSRSNDSRTFGQKMHSDSFYDHSGNYPGSMGSISKGY